jgi:acetyl-CoA synthetase
MSDMGWMVGPKVIVGATLMGATMVLTDGAPDWPENGRIWRLAADHGVTILGIAPTMVRTMMSYDIDEVRRHDLSRLRVATSAGEPWDPEAWLWFFTHACRRTVPILNYSGGTEVGGAILVGTLHHPLKPCAFAGSVPGHGALVVDDAGRPVAPGGVGDLAMRRVSIGLTRGLWRDPERYIESYWSRFPGIWTHGDWASIDDDGLWYIHGRSDDTIKLAGKRTGPAEIESLLMATGEIVEAAAVGLPDPVKGQSVVCVCVPRAGRVDADGRAARLEAAVVEGLGRPFRPSAIHFVADLPKTRNQKIMRRVVRAILTDTPTGDLTSLVNPEAIDELKRVAEAHRDREETT